MLVLRVGDPHVKLSNLEESKKLIEFIAQTAKENSVNQIEILGDLLHTHAIVRVEVQSFWMWALNKLSTVCHTIVLCGNHDQIGDHNNTVSALDVFKDVQFTGPHIVDIVISPTIINSVAYLPYVHDKDKLIFEANRLASQGARYLVCHQTFEGSCYENGMYAPDGINPELIDFPLIISGHIHATQEFGKVIYPGTPRWDSASDANQPKGIWLFKHNDDIASTFSREFFSTENVCTPIISITYKEGQEEPILNKNAKVSIELVGSSAWIAKEKAKFQGKCHIKTKITDKHKPENRKVGNSLEQFISANFSTMTGIDKQKLLQYMRSLQIV